MKEQLAMVIDASGCIDCKACMAACKVANKVPQGEWRNWIKSDDPEATAKAGQRHHYQPGNCMHCDNPTCVTACPTGATYKDQRDGTVVVDPNLCIGCGQCIPSCPYGARYRHPEKRITDKCNFCAERRAQGLEPACVETCPTKTRTFGDINDPESQAAKLKAKGRTIRIVNAKSDTKPNLYYTGTPGPTDWPRPAKMPTAWQTWANLAGPAMKGFLALSGLGVLGMLGKQIMMKDDKPVEDNHE